MFIPTCVLVVRIQVIRNKSRGAVGFYRADGRAGRGGIENHHTLVIGLTGSRTHPDTGPLQGLTVGQIGSERYHFGSGIDFQVQTELGSLNPGHELAAAVVLFVFGGIFDPHNQVALVVVEVLGNIHSRADQFVRLAADLDRFLSHSLARRAQLLAVLRCVGALVVVEITEICRPVVGTDLIDLHIEFVDIGGVKR